MVLEEGEMDYAGVPRACAEAVKVHAVRTDYVEIARAHAEVARAHAESLAALLLPLPVRSPSALDRFAAPPRAACICNPPIISFDAKSDVRNPGPRP